MLDTLDMLKSGAKSASKHPDALMRQRSEATTTLSIAIVATDARMDVAWIFNGGNHRCQSTT